MKSHSIKTLSYKSCELIFRMKKIILGILVGFMVSNMFCSGKEQGKEKVGYKRLSFSKDGAVENLTPVQMERDIDMLEYYIKNCYINYELIQQGKYFDFDAALSRLRKECSQSSGLQNIEFVKHIDAALYGWPDTHVSLTAVDSSWMNVISHFDYYSTGIVVIKDDRKYSVVSSDVQSVRKGWLYQPGEHDLFPLYTADKTRQVFRIGTLSDRQTTQMQLVFFDTDDEEKNVLVPVSVASLVDSSELHSPLTILQTDSQTYIRLTTLDIESNSASSVKNKLDLLTAYSAEAKKKKIIVIDVRGNPGGDNWYVARFLSGLCGNKIEADGETNIWSPGVVQSWLYVLRGFLTAGKKVPAHVAAQIRKVQKIQNKMKNEPVRYYEETEVKKKNSTVFFEGFKGKLILIMDRRTASSAETFPYLLKDATNVVILGENSYGAIAAGNILPYVLPYSKCLIYLPCTRFSSSYSLPHELDDGMGYSPDYWISSDKELYGNLQAEGLDPLLLEKIKEKNK
jgi:hypothetical protein